MARRKKKHTLRNTLIYLGVILSLSALAYVNRQVESYLTSRISTFQLKNIKIHGNVILTRQQVLNLCGVKEGEKFLTVKPAEIAQKMLRSPFIKTASAVYSLPSTLHISVQERRPIAFVLQKELLLVDNEGVLLPFPKIKGYTWNLPVINGLEAKIGKVGQRTTSQKLLKAIEVLQYVQFMKSPLWSMIAAVDLSDEKVLQISLIRGGAKVRCNYEDYQSELYVLNLYIENYLNWDQLADIEYIDLRFEDRLVLKNKKKQG
ncbi:cell division protein FtsQ/DivIB [Caldithrix abyssi]|uniref:Polypeptide-transport-associated domain protein FtsQ-type n=1 Tax=Caldithrix abyssi DSM 13497 TaxID=880073 RepID=H1XY51_CALAY|nr:FtsQ-type POTRA domain-containing protein [Caldithrix abyssi]EHO41978.1 Polypeptide-transport-associated domain protein FtsQ-type [Caldithrix abyssi DSM 13497]